MKKAFKKMSLKKQKGQSLAEYGLILALIAVICIAGLGTLGTRINTGLNTVATTIGGSLG